MLLSVRKRPSGGGAIPTPRLRFSQPNESSSSWLRVDPVCLGGCALLKTSWEICGDIGTSGRRRDPGAGCARSRRPFAWYDLLNVDPQEFFAELRGWVSAADLQPATVAYGTHPQQIADLRLPPGVGPHPVAAVFHGGFRRAAFTRANTAAIDVDLTRRGFATWNVEYRRMGAGGGVPETLEDVEAALAHLERVRAPLGVRDVLLR